MKRTPPIFVSDQDTYKADTCLPLEQAASEGKLSMNAVAHGSYPGRQLSKKILPGLSSIGYWDASVKQQWGLPWHRNEGVEVCFLETGKLDFRIEREENQYELQPGNITITHPWQQHRIGNPLVGPSRLHWIIFDVNVRRPNQPWKWPNWIILSKNDIQELTDFFRHTDQPVWQSTKHLRECFIEIAHMLGSEKPDDHLSLLSVKINELFILLLEQFRMHKPVLQPSISSSQKTVEIFLENLESNIDSVSYLWTVDEMAGQCGLGKTQFRRYCKQLTNMLPMDYLAKCRINGAIKLMTEDRSISITKLAFLCGFNSSQYFSNTFKKIKGVSPKQFITNLNEE
jgi:AraC family L-rhamnose operon regulatory protein RhaS